jgi:outer membrane cobalamin receptor
MTIDDRNRMRPLQRCVRHVPPFRTLCLLGSIGAASSAGAQPAAPAPTPVTTVVTVTGSPMPLATESASVTVIPQETIAASFAGNAAELLQQTSYLNAEQQGGDMAFTTVTVRGGKPNQLLVLIDGVPVNDLSNELGGSFDFSSLALANIDHVEIVRGPLSSVYGSEAVSGVVNFITKKTASPSLFSVDDGFGSLGAAQVNASGAGMLGRAGYSLAGATSTIGDQTGNDSAALYTGDAGLNLPFGVRRDLTAVSRYAVRHANEFPTGSGGPEYALDRSAETDRTGDLVLGENWQHQANDLWLYRVESNLFRRTAFNYTPPILDAIPPTANSQPSSQGNTRFSRFDLREANSFTLGSRCGALVAAGWRRESGAENNVLDGNIPDDFQLVRDTGETAAEFSVTGKRVSATAGVGTSSTPGFGTVGSPRAGASLLLTSTTRLKGSYGQAFDLPSFYSYAQPLVGNPHLLPERLKAWDAGIEQSIAPHFDLSATWFHDHYDDLISFSSAVFHLVNLNAAITSGVELGSHFSARAVDLHAWGSWLTWQVQGSTEPLRNQPHGQGGFSIDWKPNRRVLIGGDLTAMGARYDYELPAPQIDKAGAFTTTTLRAQWELRRNLAVHLRLENAFNQCYQQFIGFPDPGIRVRAGLAWTFAGTHGHT